MLAGLDVFEDRRTGHRALESWDGNFREADLAEVEFDNSARVSRYDSQWITKHLQSDDSSWFGRYLSGEPTDTPLWEFLVAGRGYILGTDVGQRDYETIKGTWPSSLPLLELSRVAVELGSDLGLIAPLLTIDNNGWVDVRLYLNFEDADSAPFLERFAKYGGPKNTADLNASSELVVP